MNHLDDNGKLQCKFVSDLFEYSTKAKDCSSKIFIKSYVYSSISKRSSSKFFIFESIDYVAAYEIIKKEKKLERGNDIYPSYVMSWIGYIMKYFSLSTSIPETVLYKKMKPEEFYLLYEAYHSLDNELVVKRIAEAKKINLNLNDVEIMKNLK